MPSAPGRHSCGASPSRPEAVPDSAGPDGHQSKGTKETRDANRRRRKPQAHTLRLRIRARGTRATPRRAASRGSSYLPGLRGPMGSVAQSSGPRSGRLGDYEDGDPAASAASPTNAALPARSLGTPQSPPIQCGRGPGGAASASAPTPPLRSLGRPALTRAATSRAYSPPHARPRPDRPETTRAPRRGPTRACAQSPTPRVVGPRRAPPTVGRGLCGARPLHPQPHTHIAPTPTTPSLPTSSPPLLVRPHLPLPLHAPAPTSPPQHPSPYRSASPSPPPGDEGPPRSRQLERDLRTQMKKLTKLAQPSNFLCLFFFLALLPGLWDVSSPTRDGTRPSAVRAWSPYHWTAREFPKQFFFKCE